MFFTFNMSLGINLLVDLAKRATKVLGDQFDIEIVEKHHNLKKDAPSGTAIMIAEAINEELGNKMHYVYDRHSVRKPREKTEIGMHSIRGGTIVGEHDVIFAGTDEVVTFSHTAYSREGKKRRNITCQNLSRCSAIRMPIKQMLPRLAYYVPFL